MTLANYLVAGHHENICGDGHGLVVHQARVQDDARKGGGLEAKHREGEHHGDVHAVEADEHVDPPRRVRPARLRKGH